MSIVVAPQRQSTGLRDIISALSLYNDWKRRQASEKIAEYNTGLAEMEDSTPGLLERLGKFLTAPPTEESVTIPELSGFMPSAQREVDPTAPLPRLEKGKAYPGMGPVGYEKLRPKLSERAKAQRDLEMRRAMTIPPSDERKAAIKKAKTPISEREMLKYMTDKEYRDYARPRGLGKREDVIRGIKKKPAPKIESIPTHRKNIRGKNSNAKSAELYRLFRRTQRDPNRTPRQKFEERLTAWNMQENLNEFRDCKKNRYSIGGKKPVWREPRRSGRRGKQNRYEITLANGKTHQVTSGLAEQQIYGRSGKIFGKYYSQSPIVRVRNIGKVTPRSIQREKAEREKAERLARKEAQDFIVRYNNSDRDEKKRIAGLKPPGVVLGVDKGWFSDTYFAESYGAGKRKTENVAGTNISFD